MIIIKYMNIIDKYVKFLFIKNCDFILKENNDKNNKNNIM